mgnify:CR=1 FL=1
MLTFNRGAAIVCPSRTVLAGLFLASKNMIPGIDFSKVPAKGA